MSGPETLLAVFAHPDDESFRCGGMLALLARRGVRVLAVQIHQVQRRNV